MDDSKLERILTLMSHQDLWSEGNILAKGYTNDDIAWLLLNDYIKKAGLNSVGEQLYVITEKGIRRQRGY